MMGIGPILLIAAAAGYLVLARATEKTGWVKVLGFVLGLLTIGWSLVSLLAIPIQMKRAESSGMIMGGRPGMGGQLRPPQFQMPPPPHESTGAENMPGATKK